MPGGFRSSAGSVSTFNGATFTGADVTVAKPAGAADDDLLIAVGYCDPGWTIDAPGWEELAAVTGTARHGKVWGKRAASEPAAYTFPLSAGGHGESIAAGILAYQGVGDIEDVSITEGAAGTTATAPAILLDGPDRIVLWFGIIQSSGSTLDPGAGWTSRLNISEAGGAASTQDGLSVYEQIISPAGSTGPIDGVASSAWGGHVAGLIAFPQTPVGGGWIVGIGY